MITDRNRLVDGISSLEGGMDSGRSPSMIGKNQVAYAQNVTFRGGFARTRAGFKRIKLASGSATTAMEDAKFQGAHYYQHSNGSGSIIVVAGGNTYKISPPTSGAEWSVTDITNSITMSSTVSRVHFLQAENHLIIQDGANLPLLWDGSTVSRSNATTNQVPVGTAMAYGNGRIWVAQGRSFVAGDILGGASTILQFTENDRLANGGSFTVPVGTSDITSMEFIAAPNTALGHGELIIFTADAVTSVSVPADRNDWFALNDPIQRVVLINNGATGDHSVEHVSGDLYFRSRDGLRSLVMAVRDQEQYGNTPISREMNRILKYDSPAYFSEVSGVLFNNRYICTAIPKFDNSRGVAYSGLVVLDFDLMSGLKGKLPLAYDGFWSLDVTRNSTDYTLQFAQLVKGNFSGTERCFGLVRNESLDTELWELTLDGDSIFDVDLDGSGNAVNNKITSQVETPSFDFDQPAAAKELESADLWVDELTGGTVQFHTDFHPDQYPCWVSWQNWNIIAEYTAEECESFVDAEKQYRPRMRIGRPSDDVEPAVDKRFNYGWEFAARIKWTGQARLKLFRVNARTVQEEPYADVEIDSSSKVIACDCLGGVSSATNQ